MVHGGFSFTRCLGNLSLAVTWVTVAGSCPDYLGKFGPCRMFNKFLCLVLKMRYRILHGFCDEQKPRQVEFFKQNSPAVHRVLVLLSGDSRGVCAEPFLQWKGHYFGRDCQSVCPVPFSAEGDNQISKTPRS